jgi:hypothetical protein
MFIYNYIEATERSPMDGGDKTFEIYCFVYNEYFTAATYRGYSPMMFSLAKVFSKSIIAKRIIKQEGNTGRCAIPKVTSRGRC